MALTASGQLSLGDIATEMGASLADVSLTTQSTTDINTSSPSYPDGATPHAISEFYSYDHSASPPLTAFSVDEGTYGNPGTACADGSANTTFYHNGAGAYPTTGDTVYIDEEGTTSPADGIYWMGNNSVININSGVVGQSANC